MPFFFPLEVPLAIWAGFPQCFAQGNQFTYPARRSGCLHTRRRARVSSPLANTWVTRYPSRDAVFLSFGGATKIKATLGRFNFYPSRRLGISSVKNAHILFLTSISSRARVALVSHHASACIFSRNWCIPLAVSCAICRVRPTNSKYTKLCFVEWVEIVNLNY